MYVDFHIIPDGFCCLPSGKFTSRSQAGKFLESDISLVSQAVPAGVLILGVLEF